MATVRPISSQLVAPRVSLFKPKRTLFRSQRSIPTTTTHSSSSQNGTSECITADEAAAKYGWELDNVDHTKDNNVMELPLAQIRRPHTGLRSNDQAKVNALKASILEKGLKEPIDILEVDGIYYGFNGCHRFQAHQELGLERILCRVRKANKQILKFHLM